MIRYAEKEKSPVSRMELDLSHPPGFEKPLMDTKVLTVLNEKAALPSGSQKGNSSSMKVETRYCITTFIGLLFNFLKDDWICREGEFSSEDGRGKKKKIRVSVSMP